MYAVLQTSLDQPITREALESAVMSTQTLAKPDCARLQRELFGFVAEKLSQEDALGLQAGLRAQGIETEVIDEANLPTLPPPRRPQSFSVSPDTVTVTEYTGEHRSFPMSAFVFAAAGHLKHLSNVPERKLEWVQKYTHHGRAYSELESVTERELKNVPEFRIEFYFTQEPFRFQCVLDEKTIVRAADQILRLRDRNQLDNLLLHLANAFPAVQTNLGIRAAATGQGFIYPSVHAFEEEIVWSLHRMANGGLS